jgi:hypothetical protein
VVTRRHPGRPSDAGAGGSGGDGVTDGGGHDESGGGGHDESGGGHEESGGGHGEAEGETEDAGFVVLIRRCRWRAVQRFTSTV